MSYKFNPAYNHEMVTEQSFRPAGAMDLIYDLQGAQYSCLKDLDRLCRKLDLGFYQNSKYNLRVHAIYFKPGDKYVNVSCRLKNCGFRINHKYTLVNKKP